jgi:hypothetical protein
MGKMIIDTVGKYPLHPWCRGHGSHPADILARGLPPFIGHLAQAGMNSGDIMLNNKQVNPQLCRGTRKV